MNNVDVHHLAHVQCVCWITSLDLELQVNL